ncbi:oocyte zinc finger protein XlCOF8.4-like [Mercenaria mercenaria]|uniref:oocyte zinc finger protein XlCOF8.4-like n=1 Tax=Mercenaria mercenaria TaxID=6596 RepID=UPI001E1D59BF|nr:oocyte zinc finger protein XlCOF8.4-like [Mercenaria mercenaria]
MNTGELNCSAIPSFLASTTSLVLQPGSIIRTVPMDAESLLLETATKHSGPARKGSLDDLAASRESKVPVVKASAKGRRPKSLITEIQPGFELGMGMLADRPMCGSCGKYFMSRQQLNQHMLVHTDVRKYKCTYCQRTFKQPSHLHQHHRIHTGEKPYKCPMPGCFRAFPQQSNLNHHLRNHDKPAPPPENTCSLCMRVYASETVLRSHISKIHMCDPDMLLGARKKTLTKDISQTGENVAQVISPSSEDIRRIKFVETNNNDSSDESNIQTQCAIGKHMDNLTNSSLVPKQETVNGSNASAHFGYVQESDDLSEKNRSTYQRRHNVKAFVVKDTVTGKNTSTKIVQANNSMFHNTPIKADNNLLHHFIATTTHGPAFNGGNDLDMIHMNGTGGKVDAFEAVVTSNSNLSQFMLNTNVNDKLHSDMPVSDETVPSHVGRSRKRKAFQPQRIIQKLDMNDDQEHNATTPF